MITLDSFIALMESQGPISEAEKKELSDHWEQAMEAALSAGGAMPGIGFASPTQRINAFLAVCRHLDQMIGEGRIDIAQSQLAINILRLSNKKFNKAVTMFDLRSNRFSISAQAELPHSAQEYLAGILYIGR